MFKINTALTVLLLSTGLLGACSQGSDNGSGTVSTPQLNLNIPDSLTGGQAVNTVPKAARVAGEYQTLRAASAGTGQPCAFIGNDDDQNPFRNGYETTKFMTSILASWTCIADLLIDTAKFVPHDGSIIETDNDNNTAGFDEDDPTHYSVTDESNGQVTVRLYYNYSRSNPPVSGEQPQFYISWIVKDNGNTEGRMIIDSLAMNKQQRKLDDPIRARIDFTYTATEKVADMFLQFDDNNTWADGFRMLLTRHLDTNPLLKVFEAQGLIKMKDQFIAVPGITELPLVQLYAVTDGLGNGASIAEFQNMSFPLEINPATGNHLGNYLFTRKDSYFFKDDMQWEYINKLVQTAEYRGGRTTPASGGSWIPFDPSLDLIISGLALDPGYFTGGLCETTGNDCSALLDAVFNLPGGFGDLEPNQGTDPLDWRTDALTGVVYLDTVYPNGVDWTNAFDMTFNPLP